MFARIPRTLQLVLLLLLVAPPPSSACCPAPVMGSPVVNADQTVIIIWDPATRTQHFIRQASFKSEGGDFGFLIPSPTRPELAESGDEAFPYLARLTAPPPSVHVSPLFIPIGCACSMRCAAPPPDVRVVEEKRVAGFDAVVLEARSATALVGWLKDHGYDFSPEVEAWAKPYVDSGWMITALKIVKNLEENDHRTVAAASLRMSFKTDRPLFPYREPDSRTSAEALAAHNRLLRVYFIADARYRGDLTRITPGKRESFAWTGKAVWSKKMSEDDRQKVLQMLKLPPSTGPAEWWLTEFEDDWPYKLALGDLYFTRDRNQQTIRRHAQAAPSGWPTDAWFYAIAAAVTLPPLVRRARRRRMAVNPPGRR